MSSSLGLVDFAIGLVNSVINLPDGQVKFFEEFKLQKNCEINLLIKTFLGLVEMMFRLVNVSFSLPKWQAVKMTFFAPWLRTNQCIFLVVESYQLNAAFHSIKLFNAVEQISDAQGYATFTKKRLKRKWFPLQKPWKIEQKVFKNHYLRTSPAGAVHSANLKNM